MKRRKVVYLVTSSFKNDREFEDYEIFDQKVFECKKDATAHYKDMIKKCRKEAKENFSTEFSECEHKSTNSFYLTSEDYEYFYSIGISEVEFFPKTTKK